MNWQEFLDIIFCSSCKKQNLELLDKWQECQGFTRTQAQDIGKLTRENEVLKLLVPHPAPPEIDYIVEKDTVWIQGVLDGLGLGLIRIPLDAKYYLTDKNTFASIIYWDWIDTVKYIPERFDCENFSFSFKAQVDEVFLLNQVGVILDYASGHAYNIAIFPDGGVWLLEPQSDALFCWSKRLTDFYSLKGAIVII